MNTKKIVIILTILVIITIIIGIILLLLNANNSANNNDINKKTEEYIATPSIEDDPIEIKESLEKVTVRNNYYVVKNCIIKFYTYYSAIYNAEETNLIRDEEAIASLENEKKQNIEAVYSILDEKYKKYKNITLENLESQLNAINRLNIEISDMYVSQKTENMNIYFVNGYLIEISTSQISEFSMMVNIDMLNRTYTVLLEDYIKENYSGIKTGENIDISYPDKIEANTYNTFRYQAITDDTYITDIFNSFRENLIYNKSEVYENLNDTYKQKRFGTLENFKQYINDGIREISMMKLSKYQKTKYNEYTQYVCLADSGKYYIINVYSPTEIEFILDTYTIELPEFLEKYEASDEKTKVALNIQKIKDAINENDFKYVYDKLDNIFKQNNYPDYNNFKNYLKSNLFENNTFEYKNIEKHGDVYVANIIINESKKMDIIMKLSDDTSFYISFNIEE